MNLATAIKLYATAAGTGSEGSSLINRPNDPNNDIRVKDIARRRLVKTNPDVDEMEACPSAWEGKTVQEQLDNMMEERMFSKEESGKGWVTYSRGDNNHKQDGWRDGRWIKIFFKGTGRDGIGKVICHSDEGPVRVKHGWDAAYSFAQAYGD